MDNYSNLIKDLGGKENIHNALKSNLAWILKSFNANKNQGSSAYRTVTGKWGEPYPETTGYLIPTLINGSKYYFKEDLREVVFSQLQYFKSLQNFDGSFARSQEDKRPIVFDTAQIILGLLHLAPLIMVSPENILDIIQSAKNWLANQLNDKGIFEDHNYVEGYNPSYYARIAWPLIACDQIFDSKAHPKSKALIEHIKNQQQENLWFESCAIHPNQNPLTHNIAYTLRGLWECSELLNDLKLRKKVTKTLNHLSQSILENKQLGGVYDKKWKPDLSFSCTTGNAQLAHLYLLVYKLTRNEKYLEPVKYLVKPLMQNQRKWGANKGAIPASLPMWGPYQRFKYTNWSQKFYSDTLIELLKLDRR